MCQYSFKKNNESWKVFWILYEFRVALWNIHKKCGFMNFYKYEGSTENITIF